MITECSVNTELSHAWLNVKCVKMKQFLFYHKCWWILVFMFIGIKLCGRELASFACCITTRYRGPQTVLNSALVPWVWQSKELLDSSQSIWSHSTELKGWSKQNCRWVLVYVLKFVLSCVPVSWLFISFQPAQDTEDVMILIKLIFVILVKKKR